MDQIWWKQIPRANRFLYTAAEALLNNRSVILPIQAVTPWRQTMYDMVEEILNIENPRNRLETFDCPEGDVGEYLFSKYCKREKRATYRRGTSYAAFLARSEDLVLNNCYLWVRNIRGRKLEEWTQFIVEYNRNLPPNRQPAVFLLETPEEEWRRKAVKGIQCIVFSESVDAYDSFAFCALASAGVSIAPALRTYLAELCSTLCGQDIELCAACIRWGQQFLKAPEETLREIAGKEIRSDGTPFVICFEGDSIRESIWKSQIRALFPILQQYRSTLVRQHYEEIARSLPITTPFGEVIDDPQDVELGPLISLAGRHSIFLSGEEYDLLDLFRDARNRLAHMKPVEFSVVNKILSAQF